MAYLDQVRIDQELLLEFLTKFSRFEFAMKLSGYIRERDDSVEPDWERFSSDIDGLFDKENTAMLTRACDYILLNPPYEQILVGGALGWSSCFQREANTETELLLDLVRRVRNNLCHGGMYDARIHQETAQSEAFLRGSLLIIEECLRVSPAVKQAFHGEEI